MTQELHNCIFVVTGDCEYAIKLVQSGQSHLNGVQVYASVGSASVWRRLKLGIRLLLFVLASPQQVKP